jgi:hypothetical protein
MTKKVLPIIIVFIAIGGGAFYGGIKYTESKTPNASVNGANFRNFQNMSPEERQNLSGQTGTNRIGANRGVGFGGVNGELLSKNEDSITVKLNDGGSKIVYFVETTKVSKTVDGAIEDLQIGANVMVSGDANEDGSVIARTIQIRSENIAP